MDNILVFACKEDSFFYDLKNYAIENKFSVFEQNVHDFGDLGLVLQQYEEPQIFFVAEVRLKNLVDEIRTTHPDIKIYNYAGVPKVFFRNIEKEFFAEVTPDHVETNNEKVKIPKITLPTELRAPALSIPTVHVQTPDHEKDDLVNPEPFMVETERWDVEPLENVEVVTDTEADVLELQQEVTEEENRAFDSPVCEEPEVVESERATLRSQEQVDPVVVAPIPDAEIISNGVVIFVTGDKSAGKSTIVSTLLALFGQNSTFHITEDEPLCKPDLTIHVHLNIDEISKIASSLIDAPKSHLFIFNRYDRGWDYITFQGRMKTSKKRKELIKAIQRIESHGYKTIAIELDTEFNETFSESLLPKIRIAFSEYVFKQFHLI